MSESSHIKGVPLVLRISAFMHGHGHRELAKKINDKISKMVDEMFERVRAFIRGEMAIGSAKIVRPFQGDKGNTRLIWLGGQEKSNQKSGNQRRNDVKVIHMIAGGRNHKRPYEEERSGLTEELPFSAIPQNILTDEPIILEGMIEGHQIRRIHVDNGSSSEIMYENCFRSFNTNVWSRLRKCKASLVGFSSKIYHPLRLIDLWVTMG
uniref:Reverse transcriptase domain-containing protein n=1 Tax=Tanacetum cinerariifolium TaxID=118510 RepID=A0A6L2NF09_TANCI|nr:reverse transcriptase domain-containing protein [Tanacetum cinerariifolium]